MPITGTFGADFSAFQTAVDQATTKLISFEGNATNVTNSLSRMEKSFSGVKIIQDATMMADAIERVGGVSKLTADELEAAGVKAEAAAEKMRAMGMTVPPQIQNIVDAAKDAKGAWGDFVHDFSATEAIEHPLSTVTAGVKALAAEMGPGAVAAVAWGGGIIAAGTALFELTEKAAAVGGQLNDMSERTGVNVVQLSKYKSAIEVAGGSLDTFGDAFFKLQKGLGEDSKKVADGLEKIGISVDDLKAAGPDHYLELIALGFSNTEDPAKRAAAAAEIFRDKTGQMIPVLLKLNEGLKATNDITPWTTQQAADAEKFDMQIQSITVHAKAMATALGRELIPAVGGLIETFGPWAKWAAQQTVELTGMPGMYRTAADAVGWVSAAYDVLAKKADLPITIKIDTEDAKKKLKDLQFDAARTPDMLVKAWKDANSGVKMDTLETALGNLNEMLGDTENVTEDQVAANLKLKNAFDELASAGKGWQGTVDSIDGAVVESIVSAREAGVSMQAMGVIYSYLTDTQLAGIEQLIAARKRETQELEKEKAKQAQLEAKTEEMTTRLWDEYELNRVKQLGTATEIAKAENERQYEDAVAKANQMGIVDKAYWDALEARWKQRNDAIGVDWAALQKVQDANNALSAKALQELADNAKKTYEEAAKHAGDWSDAQIKKFEDVATAAQIAADKAAVPWAKFYQQGIDAAKQEDAFTLAAQKAMQDSIIDTTKVTQAELDKRLNAAHAHFQAVLADSKSTQFALDAAVTQSAEAFYEANLKVKADFSDTSKHIGDVMTVAFDKSAQAFDAFKTIVVGGSKQMLAGLIAVTDAGTWMEQQRQMHEEQMARNPFFQYLGPTGAPPVATGLPMQYRDSGGPVTAGTPYLIGGGKEPEIFVPGANGFVTPNAGGGGITITNVFNIVDTESNITRRVSDNITRSIMAAQKL